VNWRGHGKTSPPQVETIGLEPPLKTTGKTGVSAKGGAKSGAVGAPSVPIDPDLQAVIEAWPQLPASVKTDILARVQAAEIAGGGLGGSILGNAKRRPEGNRTLFLAAPSETKKPEEGDALWKLLL